MPDFKKLATGFNAAVRAADAEASALQKMKNVWHGSPHKFPPVKLIEAAGIEPVT